MNLQTMLNKVQCPICNEKCEEFLPFGLNPRKNAMCPKCKSLERHRLLWLYFQQQSCLFSESLKVLHFAPEQCMQQQFVSMKNLDYTSADLYAKNAMQVMDITDIKYPDDSFDVIICNHVLEHIIDDYKAMSELYRVLKPEGWAVLLVPLYQNLEKTYENSSITSPEEREKAFGQKDHVRIYGFDYAQRLEKSGFKVNIDKFGFNLDLQTIKKHGLFAEDIYIGLK